MRTATKPQVVRATAEHPLSNKDIHLLRHHLATICTFTLALALVSVGLTHLSTIGAGLIAGGTGLVLILLIGILRKNKRQLLGWLSRRLLSLRYSIEVHGENSLELDPNKGILFLANHPAYIDPVIVMSNLYKNYSPRPLSDSDQASKPLVRQAMKLINPITLPNLRVHGRSGRTKVKQALESVVSHLQNNEQIILYPAGRLYRSAKEDLTGKSGVEKILKRTPDVQVILIRTSGLWGSSFSWAVNQEPNVFTHIMRNLLAIIANGIFFVPKRHVVIELARDHVVASLKTRKTINLHLENFYNRRTQVNTHVPYFWWQGRKPQQRVEVNEHKAL